MHRRAAAAAGRGPDTWTSEHRMSKMSSNPAHRTHQKYFRINLCPQQNQKLILHQVILILFIVSSSFVQCISSQSSPTHRKFPPLISVGEGKPIITDPSQSTCGIPTRTAYCKSSTFSNSIDPCIQSYCVQECPRRIKLPFFSNLLSASGYGACVTADLINRRPGSGGTDFAAVFAEGSTCYLTPLQTPSLGASGAFTLTFWVWQDVGNHGTILEKYTTADTVYRVRLSSNTLSFIYRSFAGTRELQFVDRLPARTWHFIAIQVYDQWMSYFVNGTGLGYAAQGARLLVGRVLDGGGVIRLGQDRHGTDQFVGSMQMVRFYGETLTNREIQQLYSGALPSVKIQTDCRCPSTHPHVHPVESRYCIQNGVADNTGDKVLRLNPESHPIQYINDGDIKSIWISAYTDDVFITVDLGDQFQVFYVMLQFYSPQPKVVMIERKLTDTSNWEHWQLYAADCNLAFSMPQNGPLTDPDSVNCLQFASSGSGVVPYSKGNITFQLLSTDPQPRPGRNNLHHTPALVQFVKARQVRVRLQGHYYVTHPRHKYYGLFEFMVTGRCQCNGHAESCDTFTLPYTCACLPDSYTEGNQCERCQPLYNNKPFWPGDQTLPYNCKKCNCNNHATSCRYDAAIDPFPADYDKGEGGVCVDCQHNTRGRYCNECVPGYFRAIGKSLQDPAVCGICACNPSGAENGNVDCTKVGGQCICKLRVTGRQCESCQDGYYNMQAANPAGCEPCGCNTAGTDIGSVKCNTDSGQCQCKKNVRNKQCDMCEYGFYNLNAGNAEGCSACNCHPLGASSMFCDRVTGKCLCNANIIGRQCTECANGQFDFASGCTACNCHHLGSETGTNCDKTTGQCVCKPHVTGLRCDICKDGYYNLGSDATVGCLSCGCNVGGVNMTSVGCDKTLGTCQCKANVVGRTCNQCVPNTYNLTASNALGCQDCGCDPVTTNDMACDQNTGVCSCKVMSIGMKCEGCMQESYRTPLGCAPCDCRGRPGVIRGATLCDSITGQCQCKLGVPGITGVFCDKCLDNFFGADGTCSECSCDMSGSLNNTCDRLLGQCHCKEYTQGRQCGLCKPGYSDLRAENPFGCSSMPSQQPMPRYEAQNSTSLRLLWNPPDYPNGVIIKYELWRDNVKIAELLPPFSALEYTDEGLQPFTVYSYQVVAFNSHGSTTSPVASFRTPSGTPTGGVSLQLLSVGVATASFSWNQPQNANGMILKYKLTSQQYDQPPATMHVEGLLYSYVATDLAAFTNYTFYVSACTSGGCLVSPGVSIVTRETLPAGQAPPNITALSSSELFLNWDPPAQANGYIIFYELWMRGPLASDGTRQPVRDRIFNPAGRYDPRPIADLPPFPLTAPATNYTATQLKPFYVYEFQVISENSIGKTASPWVIGRTLESAPVGMSLPVVTGVSSDSLNISWSPPPDNLALGVITNYTVHHLRKTDPILDPFAPPFVWTAIASVPGQVFYHVGTGFPAYTEQQFKVEACNSMGCVNSSQAGGTTLPAVASGLTAPRVEGLNDSSMSIDWQPPQQPNGPNPSYKVHCTQSSLNRPPPKVGIGTRFPGAGYYVFPPDTIPQGVGFTGFEVWFKTKQRNGLLLFAASEGGQEEFLALQLREGRPWFVFNPQGCTINVTIDTEENITFSDGKWHQLKTYRFGQTTNISVDGIYTGCTAIVTTTDDEGLPYNDNQWHHLHATRDGKKGVIILDRKWTGDKEENCAAGNVIGRNTAVYIGGIPPDYNMQRTNPDVRKEVMRTSFIGCLRDFRILQENSPEKKWENLDWSTVIRRSDANPEWEGCPVNLEDSDNLNRNGLHFLGTGYLVHEPNTFLGRLGQLKFEFEFRTEAQNGMLFFFWGGKGVYFLLQMISGGMSFIYSTGIVRGSLVMPSDKLQLCNGVWHSVKIEKQGLMMRMEITPFQSQPYAVMGASSGVVNMYVSSVMYIGGVPQGSVAYDVILENNLQTLLQKSFGGCLRLLRINRKLFDIIKGSQEVRNVYLDGCPAPHLSDRPCQKSLSRTIYNGTGNATYDYNLLPFTEYLYQVEVINEAGSARSAWGSGRTKETAPTGVSGPTSCTVINGFRITCTWLPPTGHTGVLIVYILRAHSIDQPSLEPVVAYFNNTELPPMQSSFQGEITTAVPNTNYTVRLMACTAAGCTESADGQQLFTPEELPSGLAPPHVAERGGYHLVVGWDPPAMPNGVLTGYFLYMAQRALYDGNLLEFNVTDLNVFTAYQFSVKVCSRVGCTVSDTVTHLTAQLPPSFVARPSLTVLGTKSIRAEWLVPEQINGIPHSFMLFLSTVAGERGAIIYNNTDLFLYYAIPDLLAGTTYHITVAACTGGGCTFSMASTATTVESAPEGMPMPTVLSPSPSELNITWGVPEFSNGEVISYRLLHNELQIYSDPVVRQYLISNLMPWSLHRIRVEACTIKGCGSSPEVMARTMEAPPDGTVGFEVDVVTPRSVRVRWSAVAKPNGMLMYDVYFEGLYYVDPGAWDYSVVTDRRVLFEGTEQQAGTWVTVDKLIPHSSYYVQVNASNLVGYVTSTTLLAPMPQGSPDGVRPPTLTSPTATAVLAQWSGVGRVNAAQEVAFQLQYKDMTPFAPIQDLFPQPTTSNSFLKTDLQPYTQYEFRLVAINFYGQTNTEWVSITTKQDAPAGVDPPMVPVVSARTVELSWFPPLYPNGIISHYNIYVNGAEKDSVEGNVTRTEVGGLVPYTTYTFSVEACTIAGCAKSQRSTPIITNKAAPEGIAAPTLSSTTPTSVLVLWEPPQLPNGEILQYAIERRIKGQTAYVVVQTFIPTDPRNYVDDSPAVKPFEVYEYRIAAYNSAGKGDGAWADITTRASRPGGVKAPVVEVLGPTSINVTWEPPISPNGRLESYIIKLPDPRYEINNVSQTYLVINNLTPYTTYRVSVIACSEGGCTPSIPTEVTTSPSVPGGLQPPAPTPMSQTYISILWQRPDLPNGPNIRYELARMKIRQPLDVTAEGFGVWASLYIGPNLYYDDRELTIYTIYRYRITVYNDFGHTTSDPSGEVATFGGQPTKPPVVSVGPVNHTAISVSWMTPTVQELQGGVREYLLYVGDGTGSPLAMTYDPQITQTTVSGLKPNTRYTVTVVLVIHGGNIISSAPGYATTQDGAPEGLAPPVLRVLNQTALRVAWTAPQQSNGEITGYYVYLDGRRIDTNLVTAGSYVLAGLTPYTVYRVQVEVCTVYACVKSVEVKGTTSESLPVGVYPPTLTVEGATGIQVIWAPPVEPNGIILRYELLRKTKVPCSQTIPPTPTLPAGKCQYFECDVLESFCGSHCYSGPKTCCGGVVHDNKHGYECCGTAYIPLSTIPGAVCCGGNFYSPLVDHQCCGRHYVRVLAGQKCCADPVQDRVDVGYGDTCCSSVPYSSSGAQICCSGRLADRFGSQCCGGSVVSDTVTCCGNATTGKAYPSNPTNVCCGEEYMASSLSVCCVNQMGKTKVHTYASTEARDQSNQKCCGVERISAALSCCNTNGYNPMTQSCADVSSTETGCGTGVVCSVVQRSMAFCNRCNFNQGTHRCGAYSGAPSPQRPFTLTQAGTGTDMCLTDPVKLYTGSQTHYKDTSLSAYTEYQYALVVVNGAGSATSDYIPGTTAQTLPAGVSPPTATTEPTQLDTIDLSWTPPRHPNGEIQWYILQRDGVEIFRDQRLLAFTDNNAIQPYRTYSYLLQVCNGAGCTPSPEIRVATLQARPEVMAAPRVEVISPRSLQVVWKAPQKPNGLITVYRVYEHKQGLGLVTETAGTVRDHTSTDLQPSTTYQFSVGACTDVGCTNSTTTSATTLQDRPHGLDPPRVVIVNSRRAEIYWSKPTNPNGPLVGYRLFKSTASAPYILVASTGADVFMYVDTSVQPDILYWYIVEAATSVGGTNSSLLALTMPSKTPTGIPAPNARVTGPNTIFVSWVPINSPNEEIDQYFVVLDSGSKNEIAKSVGLQTSGHIPGLIPHTPYRLRVRACLKGFPNGCGSGPEVTLTTDQSAPEGQGAPRLTAQGPRTVLIEWVPPVSPNGVLRNYRIERRRRGEAGNGILIQLVDIGTQKFTNVGPEMTPYTEYEYRVTVFNTEGFGNSPWAMVRTLESPPEGMDPPTVLTVGAYSISLTWTRPLMPNGAIVTYKIEFQALLGNPDQPSGTRSVTVDGSITSTSVSGLLPYTAYRVRITAANSVGQVLSGWGRATTQQAAPADISAFQVEKVADGTSVILKWNAPGKPNGLITNYLIYEEGNINAIYQGLNREFEYRRLQPFTRYIIQLEACTVGGCGRAAKQAFVTAEVAPASQPAPSVGSVTSTSVVLQWTKPLRSNGKILSYDVLRKKVARRQKRQAADSFQVIHTTTDVKDNYQYTDPSIEPYSGYEYKIRANNDKGSTTSPVQYVATPEAPPSGVSKPIVSQVGNKPSELLVRWSEPTKANGIIQSYRLTRGTDMPLMFAASDPKEYTDRGLDADTLYSYTIKVCTGGGCTTSEPTSFRTPESSPYSVKPPSLTAVSSTAIKATWEKPLVTNGNIRTYYLKMDGTEVYSGSEMEYTKHDLTPHQLYSFTLTACTYGGCKESTAETGRPEEASPTGMNRPTAQATSSNSIEIRWDAPDNPNGVITGYEVSREGTVVYDTSGGIRYSYVDYEVNPGQEYTYTVTVYNSKGHETSPPATARTYASSPRGLAAPVLVPLSSTAIQASWQPPTQPNGDIYNYTLYQGSEVVFSDRALSYVVRNLQFWTEYTFRVQACTSQGCATSDPNTARTHEALPLELDPPRLTPLANSKGAHSGVLAEWSPPRKPNGIITKYDLYRQDYPDGIAANIRILRYNGTGQRYQDTDPRLRPYTQYQYQVLAYNSQGTVTSRWVTVLTDAAPPEGVPEPIIKETTQTTIVLELKEPAVPNGHIERYNIYLNDVPVAYSKSVKVTLGEDNPLTPYTTYTVHVEACTAGGCTAGPAVEVRTQQQTPVGITAPTITNITATTAEATWSPPAQSNGPIIRYELRSRRICPYPYADDDDSVTIACEPGAWVSHKSGDVLAAPVTGLKPFTLYEFLVTVQNTAGLVESPRTTVVTLAAAPEYSGVPPSVKVSGNVVTLDWSQSFLINAEVESFTLFKDGQVEYSGPNAKHDVLRESTYKTYEFQVKLVTAEGEAQSPKMYFDPTRPDYLAPPTIEPTETAATRPVYQEIWFIVVMVIIGLILIFIIIGVLIRCTRPIMPYIRERAPLHPRQNKTPLPDYTVNPYDIQTDMSPSNDPLTPHVGYVNPAFSHLAPSHGSLDLDRMSQKWEDDDDWDRYSHVPVANDSGLHSLAYGDDFDAASDRPISVLKEHTMFTDTHI